MQSQHDSTDEQNSLQTTLHIYKMVTLSVFLSLADSIIGEQRRQNISLILGYSGFYGLVGILVGVVAGILTSLYSQSAVETASQTQAVAVDYTTYLVFSKYWPVGFTITILICAGLGWMFGFLLKEHRYN
jgi:hypothetical protein